LETAVALHDCADQVQRLVSYPGPLVAGAAFTDRVNRLALKLRSAAYALEEPLSKAGGPLLALGGRVARELLAEVVARDAEPPQP
jgi:hypothetical protein